MNANIFSCTVPPLLVLETQIIHPELLQSLCINPCIPLGSIFLADICAWAEVSTGVRRRLRAPSLVCARTHLTAGALHQRGSRFDTSASLKLLTVKKKNW